MTSAYLGDVTVAHGPITWQFAFLPPTPKHEPDCACNQSEPPE